MVTFLVYVGCVGVIMFAAYWVIRLGVRHGVADAAQRVPYVPAQGPDPMRRAAAPQGTSTGRVVAGPPHQTG